MIPIGEHQASMIRCWCFRSGWNHILQRCVGSSQSFVLALSGRGSHGCTVFQTGPDHTNIGICLVDPDLIWSALLEKIIKRRPYEVNDNTVSQVSYAPLDRALVLSRTQIF